jgi:hypothetical protein
MAVKGWRWWIAKMVAEITIRNRHNAARYQAHRHPGLSSNLA